MKLLLVTFLVLNLVVAGWAVAIEEPTVEEPAMKNLLVKKLAVEDTDLSIRNVCNETLMKPSGQITSSNFPQNYDANLYCYWLIASSTRTKIVLSFDTFVVEENFDFVRV